MGNVTDLINSQPRSLSIDNLENHSPASGRHSLGSSPINVVSNAFLSLDCKVLDDRSSAHHRSDDTSNDSASSTTKSTETTVTRNGSHCSVWSRPNQTSVKPRPWSVSGADRQNTDFQFYDEQLSPSSHNNDSLLMDGMDNELTGINKNMVGTATGGSILGISPGTIGTSLVGGSIVGITPGAALERRSVKELAAGLNRIENPRDLPPKSLDNIPRKSISKSKLITSRFEETLAEALQQPAKRSVTRHSIVRDTRDSVDV
ncbi:uncharacterized protein LOC113374095 [Ctenocephalides felis]|uniref:uncharacterized protein LOC113374095 n=1 Tax=Ctenocephalides felis TaxID=7515 RepID=UPI000E6E34E6|nr:uncharacterized protein LOC113374095 [Ctenocephalides felis]